MRAAPLRTAGVLLAGASLALTAACGGDDTPSASPSPSGTSASGSSSASASPSTTATATPTATPSPTPPAVPAFAATPAGRKAFTRFVVERWGYALGTNDAAALVSLSPKGERCGGCQDLQAELARRTRQGWHVDFPGADVRTVTVKADGAAGPQVYVGTAKVDIPASRSFYDDGSYRNDNDAHPGATFTVRMGETKRKFVLLAFTVR